MRVPRTRGAVSGVLLILLGAWGALVPLFGPSLNLTIGPDTSWDLTTGRLWLSLLPGIAVVAGGLMLLLSANRASAGLGAWLALLGGAWFVVGGPVSQLWNGGTSQAGSALGGTARRVLEQLVYFDGLGVLIAALAGLALGRLAVRSVRDAELEREAELAAERDRVAAERDRRAAAPAATSDEPDRFARERAAEGTAEGTGRADTLTAAERVRHAAGSAPGERRWLRRRRS